MSKLKIFNESSWDERAAQAALEMPLKGLKQLPNMVGITPETARFLKWKSLKWMILKDHGRKILKGFCKHPIKYGWRYLKSLLRKKSYLRDGDFFLYNVESLEAFKRCLQKDNLFVLGFSYCHKPFECPSGRFTDQCMRDANNLVCQQCFIGKAVNALEDKDAIPLFIPTVHYIGEKMLEIVHANPKKEVLFLITACEMTLEMFGDWGNMLGVKGIGVRLDGRICNTMKAFELSEQGIKPGLTVILEDTKKIMLDLIKTR